MLDTKALAQATATIVREHLGELVDPILARIAALEARGLTPPLVAALVDDAVAVAVKAAVDAIPPPAKGDKGDPGEPGEQGPAGRDGKDGADGVGLSDAMIDRAGELVVTMTDGRIKTLGPVLGRDGRDGEPGLPGKDGLDVEDIEVTQDGAVVEFAFQVGEVRTIFEVELPEGPAGAAGRDAYPGAAKGLYDPGAEYLAMDVVSLNGSEWRAKHDAPGELPGSGWMLSASKGKRGDRGEKGADGRDGVSPVAQYLRGAELITTLSDGAELSADLSGLG